MTAAVIPLRRASGKGRQTAVVERISDLEDDLTAVYAERDTAGTELRALSARLQMAIHADRPDVALHVAGRLDALGLSLLRRGEDQVA